MKFNKHLENLVSYEAGKPIELVVREFGIDEKDVIKLASNENPYGTSPAVVKAIMQCVDKMHLYPDDSYFELKDGLATKFGVDSKNIIIGSGSDQVIEFLVHAKANEKSGVLIAGTTFAMYEIYSRLAGANVFKTEAKEHNLEQFLQIYNENKKDIGIIFLCVPNNPLGECLDVGEIYNFLTKIDSDVLVVIDCAYQEFAKFKDAKKEIKPGELIDKFPNSIYLGTFSKAYGLGGMRVGYGIGEANLIKELNKLRAPFNITTLSLKAAIEALKDDEFVSKTLEANFKEMVKFEEFAKIKQIEFLPSFTNFIVFKFEHQNASQIVQSLLKIGVIVRDLKSYEMNAIRITIGTSHQNNLVLRKLGEFIK